MYQGYNRHGSNSSRPYRGRSFGGQNKRYSNGGRSGYGRKRNFDVNWLVQKAVEPAKIEEFVPKHQFNDFVVNERIKNNIKGYGYTIPTPIQDEAIPNILEGRDVVGVANTGTGKTAAFLIPIINKIYNSKGQRALIIAPTRELAAQIQDECRILSFGMNIFSLICIGGVGMYPQIQGLSRNPEIVIGTPGRLKDLNRQGRLRFENYNIIVLDEVDRMLDMGFITDIKFIIGKLPQNRQSLFFSATLPPSIHEVMNAFLRNPITISVKSQETALNVDQDIIKTNGKPKLEVLHDLLRTDGFDKVLVFGRTKFGIEKLARQLADKGFSVASIHGNKNQGQRQRALDQFKQNRVTILLATDIASRGIDVKDITHVINFDLPESYNDYVHRIGRTGRANKKGIALSFID